MHAYYAARAPYYDAVYLKPERQADIAFLECHLPQRLHGHRPLRDGSTHRVLKNVPTEGEMRVRVALDGVHAAWRELDKVRCFECELAAPARAT